MVSTTFTWASVLSDGSEGRALNAGRWWAATGDRVVNTRGGTGSFFSSGPPELARVSDLGGTSSTVGMSGERGVGGSLTSSGGGGGGEAGIDTDCLEMVGPVVRLAKGSSS